MTECSPVITANSPTANRLGSVGRAIPGVTLRIAADGEVLCSGPNVMLGYYNKPEATAETLELDAEGRVLDAHGRHRASGRRRISFHH